MKIQNLTYPKIQTLYGRDENFKIVRGKLRLPEFNIPAAWDVTEKVDGTNIRVILKSDGTHEFNGRKENSEIPKALLAELRTLMPPGSVAVPFAPGTEAVIFGEGYGPKIQKNGDRYRETVGFRIFDIAVRKFDEETGEIDPWVWWLERDDMESIADILCLGVVPLLANHVTIEEAEALVHGKSLLAEANGMPDADMEGVVAKTSPGLMMRNGARLMWKLKVRDLE